MKNQFVNLQGIHKSSDISNIKLFSLTCIALTIAVFAGSAYGFDENKFAEAQKLYEQRSFRDATKLGNALAAAQLFEQVVQPGDTDPVIIAMVQTWVARSYYSAADTIKNEQDKTQALEKINRFEKSYKAGEAAIELLGFAKPLEGKQPAWQAFQATLTDPQRRAVATDATYHLAAAYGQWGRLKKDNDFNFVPQMRWRIPQLLQAGRGIEIVGGEAAYNYGSKRVIGKSLNTLRYSSARALIPTEDFDPDSAVQMLTDARDMTLIPETANNPVSKHGFNNTGLAQAYYDDSLYFKNRNLRPRFRQMALKVINDFIERYTSNPQDFDARYVPENEDAFELARELQAAWQKP